MRRIFRPPRIRSKNKFVIVVIVIAIVAVLGALLAYTLLVKKPTAKPTPPPPPPPPPQQVDPFQSPPIQKWEQDGEPEKPVRRTRPRNRDKPRPESLGDSSIGATMRRLGARFNQCARQYGGMGGSVVRVGFSVSPEGGVQDSFSLAPHSSTPLGRCIANVLGGATFGRSQFGRNDIRWSITLHP